jgi:predicted ATPase
LDNCEHVAQDSAEVAQSLLRACVGTRVLATSREVLGVPGEVVWRVRPLSPPPKGEASPMLEDLRQSESVRLFIDRARLVRQDFALNQMTARPIAHICQRLDGIPLALELAAARLRVLSLKQIADGMDSQMRLLGGGSRLAAARQQTLRGTFDWSHELLTRAEQALFRRLSVFAGGHTLDAAESVGSGVDVPRESVLDHLAALVDKSLVLAPFDEDQPRYRMLEPVREYASERLAAAGETGAIRRLHRDYFLEVAERARRELFAREQRISFVEKDRDNLRAALQWSRDEPEGGEAELRLSASLGPFWFVSGPASEGQYWLNHAIARSGPQNSSALAAALMWAAQLANFSGDPRAGLRLSQRAVMVARRLGDQAALARALEIVGFALAELGDSNGALTVLLEAVDIARSTGNKRRIGNALHSLGRATEDSGDPRTAERLYQDALEALCNAGEKWRRFEVMFDLGRLAIEAGNIDVARVRFEQIVKEFRPPGSLWMTVPLGRLAEVARLQGQMAVARQHACEALESALITGDRIGMAAALVISAHLLIDLRQADVATRIYAAVTAWRTRGNVSTRGGPFRWVVPGLHEYDADWQALRHALGNEDFTTAWTDGGQFSLEEAIAEARTVLCSDSA